MHDLNDALDELRQVIPYAHSPSVRKLSKIATLLLAKNYILMQANALNELRRLLVCLHQHSASSLPQPLSASVAALIGSSAPLSSSHTQQQQQHHKQNARIPRPEPGAKHPESWAQGGATVGVSAINPSGGAERNVAAPLNGGGGGCGKTADLVDEQQTTSVQNRRRKYNMLINRILGDVAAQQLMNPLQLPLPPIMSQAPPPPSTTHMAPTAKNPIDFCTQANHQRNQQPANRCQQANSQQRLMAAGGAAGVGGQPMKRPLAAALDRSAASNVLLAPSCCASSAQQPLACAPIPAPMTKQNGHPMGPASRVRVVEPDSPPSRPPSPAESCSSLVSVGSPQQSRFIRSTDSRQELQRQQTDLLARSVSVCSSISCDNDQDSVGGIGVGGEADYDERVKQEDNCEDLKVANYRSRGGNQSTAKVDDSAEAAAARQQFEFGKIINNRC